MWGPNYLKKKVVIRYKRYVIFSVHVNSFHSKFPDILSTLFCCILDRVVSLENELVQAKSTEKADTTLVASAFDQTITNHLDDSDLDSGLEDDENLKGMNYYGQSIYSVSYLIQTVNKLESW